MYSIVADNDFICPCGGGQSCIVDRRSVGDFVHEDDLFIESKLPTRKHCFTKFTKKQENVMKQFIH